jgi:hypothetical protein
MVGACNDIRIAEQVGMGEVLFVCVPTWTVLDVKVIELLVVEFEVAADYFPCG